MKADKRCYYRGICLLNVPEKVNGRIFPEELLEVTEGKDAEERGGLSKVKAAWIRNLQSI